MSRTIVVTDEQVANAQALMRIAGGPDHVDPLIRKIAEAKPRTTASANGSRAS